MTWSEFCPFAPFVQYISLPNRFIIKWYISDGYSFSLSPGKSLWLLGVSIERPNACILKDGFALQNLTRLVGKDTQNKFVLHKVGGLYQYKFGDLQREALFIYLFFYHAISWKVKNAIFLWLIMKNAIFLWLIMRGFLVLWQSLAIVSQCNNPIIRWIHVCTVISIFLNKLAEQLIFNRVVSLRCLECAYWAPHWNAPCLHKGSVHLELLLAYAPCLHKVLSASNITNTNL